MYRASDPRSHALRSPVPLRAGALSLLAVALIVGALPKALQADRLVLRNLEILSDQTVRSFDEDGVRLESGRALAWDEIEKGSVAEARQDDFDRMLHELGEPLYRIRQRLQVGDYKALASPAEAVYGRYVGRRSPSAYMAFQATMWSRLASGQREAALEPYLYCLEYLRGVAQSEVSLPGSRRLKFDPSTGMTPELLPVWFDQPAAKAAMPGVLEAVRRMRPPLPPAARVYYGTLALAAGDEARALEVLSGIEEREGPLAELRDVAMAQGEVTTGRIGTAVSKLETSIDALSPANKPLGLYWLGTAKTLSDDDQTKREGVLWLLHLPAVYAAEHPDLAAAGLYRAMQTLGQLHDNNGSDALRGELLVNYGQTYHAMKVATPQDPRNGK